MYDKTKFIYVGIDLHKEQHTAVIMNCFNEKLGEITFRNKPSEFGKLITKAKRYCTDGKQIVFALENSYGYGRATALYFWEHYPSPRLLRGKSVEELAEELIPVSHNQFSTRKCQKILDAVRADGDTTRDYQSERDEITRGLVRDVRHYAVQLEEVNKAISEFLPRFECTLNTIPGVNDTTVAKLLSEIGDIRRFPNADKLANFAGVVPVKFSSSGKGDDKPSKQGNRRLQGTIYFLAIQMIQLSSKGLPRNPSFYAYYQKQLAKGKSKPQALILISRRLINIIYGMLKNKTEYKMPEVWENRN